MPTAATKRLMLDSDGELNTDGDDSDAAADSISRPQPFAGVMFYVHGEWAGWTRGKVQRAIERHGGKISKTPAFDENHVTHLVLGGQLWSRQGTALPDKTVQAVVAANEANRTAEDPDRKGSIAAGVKLPEAAYDFERQQDAREQEEELQQLCSRSRSPRKMRKKNDGTAEVSSDIGGSDAPGSAKAASGPSGSEDGKAQRRNKDDATLSLADAQNGQIRETEESPHVDRDDIGGLARDIALQVANDFEKLRISGGGGASGKQAVDENRQREVIASVVASFLSKWN